MRPRAQSYRTLDGHTAEGIKAPWYWRVLAVVSTLMILGGFLMLPATFDNDPKLRISRSALVIFGIVILGVGVSGTALLAFAVRNPSFHIDSIFAPSLISCTVGLLTVLYDLLISARYVWSTSALVIVVVASVSTIVYAGLLIWTHRRSSSARAPVRLSMQPVQPPTENTAASAGNLWQEPAYYQNYIQNMYPAASTHNLPQTNYQGYQDSNAISEEEMQRQQMLMLLLKKDQAPTPNQTSDTYHLEWNGQEQDDVAPLPTRGFHAPQSASSGGSTHPVSAISRHFTTHELRQPWDGVWRSPVAASRQASGAGRVPIEVLNARTRVEPRDQRRRDVEYG